MWRNQAECLTVDPELFFPLVLGRPLNNRTAEDKAKAVCAKCPVVGQCLAEAVDRGEAFGIWGGMTPEERQHSKRALRKLSIGAKRSAFGAA